MSNNVDELKTQISTLENRVAEQVSDNDDSKKSIEELKKKVSEQNDMLDDAMAAQKRWADEKDVLES